MLEAKLKENYRWPTVVALNGQEYIKTEFRPVPMDREEEARTNKALIVRERPGRKKTQKRAKSTAVAGGKSKTGNRKV